MTEQDDDKLRKLLKKSPGLTPPESFYRSVMEKIEGGSEKARERAKEKSPLTRSPAPWYWGYPARGLATACVLLVIVLVTRETKKNEPQLMQPVMREIIQTESKPAPKSFSAKTDENYYWQGTQQYNRGRLGEAFGSFEKSIQRKQNTEESKAYLQQIRQEVVNNAKKRSDEKSPVNAPQQNADKAVQNQLNKSIAGYVGTPSPFKELDEEEMNGAPAVSRAKAAAPSAWPMQARDMTGMAAQNSFSKGASLGGRGGTANIPRAVTATSKSMPAPAAPQEFALKELVPGEPVRELEPSSKNERLANGYGLQPKGIVAGQKLDSTLKDQHQVDWHGTSSAVTSPRQVVVRSQDAWQATWPGHGKAPPIDFASSLVVAVFAGTKPSAGYGIEIVDVQTLADKVVVVYREKSPPAGAMTAQMLTQPYCLRVIPKSSLPITFQKLSQ